MQEELEQLLTQSGATMAQAVVGSQGGSMSTLVGIRKLISQLYNKTCEAKVPYHLPFIPIRTKVLYGLQFIPIRTKVPYGLPFTHTYCTYQSTCKLLLFPVFTEPLHVILYYITLYKIKLYCRLAQLLSLSCSTSATMTRIVKYWCLLTITR